MLNTPKSGVYIITGLNKKITEMEKIENYNFLIPLYFTYENLSADGMCLFMFHQVFIHYCWRSRQQIARAFRAFNLFPHALSFIEIQPLINQLGNL